MVEHNPFAPITEWPPERLIPYMAEVGAEFDEMALYSGIDETTLRTEWADVILKGRVKGMLDLRAAQHNLATMDRNPALLKHLGAHRLKQIDELIIKDDKGLNIDKGVDLKTLTKDELIAMLKTRLEQLEKK